MLLVFNSIYINGIFIDWAENFIGCLLHDKLDVTAVDWYMDTIYTAKQTLKHVAVFSKGFDNKNKSNNANVGNTYKYCYSNISGSQIKIQHLKISIYQKNVW